MLPFIRKRRISTKLQAPVGVWSVKTPQGFVVEGVLESRAWTEFLCAGMDAQLFKGNVVMAARASAYTVPGVIAL
jgi:hypothetical protein